MVSPTPDCWSRLLGDEKVAYLDGWERVALLSVLHLFRRSLPKLRICVVLQICEQVSFHNKPRPVRSHAKKKSCLARRLRKKAMNVWLKEISRHCACLGKSLQKLLENQVTFCNTEVVDYTPGDPV